MKISKSVFVTNFPEGCSARDLWKVCNDYGINLDRLVENLRTIWIGRYHLHANAARFQRPNKPSVSIPKEPNMGISKESFASVLKVGSQPPIKEYDTSEPALVLDDSCIKENDFSLSLMGKGPSVGFLGGIVCVWDPSMFIKDNISKSDYFVAIMGTWTPTSTKLLIISVYAPQESTEKRDLWSYLRSLIDRWDGETVIMGDFNEVRHEHERFGTTFNSQGAKVFKIFISLAGLTDLPLEGYAYTWAHKSASKMSKLDRFLISDGLLMLFPHLSALCLDIHLSDRRLILLKEYSFDFGPIPFCIFHSWFSMKGFGSFVEITWKAMNFIEPNGLIRMKKKLTNLLKEIHELNSLDATEISQKAKILWCIEGDENTKYFYGILNKRDLNLLFVELLLMTTIDQNVFQAVLEFFESGYIPRGCNASFIALIPKIQDAKLVKDFRPISLIGTQKKSALIFKVDFEKASDSVKWEYLLDNLKAFGFGQKWCKWINGCLETATGSVLVNGSPTPEFKFHKGLKQGDPISHFLFILIMETLHLPFSKVINAGLFKGISINASFTISHLFYADDAVFVREWKGSNIKTIVKVDVARVANSIGCSTFSTPFKYLGVKVGDNMSRVLSWEDIINKVSTCLSKWKLKTLSIGIDLMQFMREKIGNIESASFWNDPWLGGKVLKSVYLRVFALETCKSISVASKLSHPSFSYSFRRLPRGGVEVEQFILLSSCINDVILPNMCDRWIWSLDASGLFSVKSTRHLIDDILLPKVDDPTRWVKVIPIKVNIHAWRVCLEKIPTRLNLSLRGIDIPSISCPLYNLAVESTSYIFFSCPLARQVRSKVMRWWELEDNSINCYGEWLNCLVNTHLPKHLKTFLEVWIILNLRRCRSYLAPKVMETLRVVQPIKRRQSTSVQGLLNKFTWYKNTALITRIAIYLGQTRFDLTFVSTSWRHPWDPTLGITPKRMSAMANTTPIVTTVTKPVTNPRDTDATPRVNIQDFCEEYYEDILPIIMDKVRRDKRKEVHARLDSGEVSRERRTREGSHYSSARTLSARPERLKVRDRLRYNDGHVFDRLGHRRQSAFDRISKTYSPSTTESRPSGTSSRDRSRGRSRPHRLDASNRDRLENKECFRGTGESYDNFHSSYETWINRRYRYHDRDRSRHMKRGRDSESPSFSVSKSDSSDGRHRKSKSKRHKPMDEDDLTMPWMCEEVAAQVERWAMPTWCHMFNSTLIVAARVRFDELPPESIDIYKDLKAVFLAYFMQQKKYIKDPIEIHNIKQKDGETIEDFMKRFKVEIGRMKGAPECMRISRFMHGVNNLELTKRFNEHVPKTMKDMKITTTAFIRGEAAAASKKKGQPRKGRGSSRFTPLTRTPKEILAAEAEKFQSTPPMVTPVEKRSSNKFCDFHNDKGHSTDECMQLKKQIEELVRAGKLSHLIKEIKHGQDQSKVGKKETPAKDKPATFYMIQSWQIMTRQKVTQSFKRVREITFSPLSTSSGAEGPLVIEAEIGGHMIHHMYVNGGSSMEVLYEHCFNRLRPKVKNQMVPATQSITDLVEKLYGHWDNSGSWSLSLYNGIIGRPGIKEIQAVPSTAHGMLKFPADGGIVTICSTILIPTECAMVITSSEEVATGGTLSAKGRTELCSLLKENLYILAWQPSDMTGVPRSVAEHCLNIREGYLPIRKKKRGHAPERAKAIQAEVQKLVEAGIMRKFYYHDWFSNPIMDCYLLPEIGWKVESLCGYPFKYFLDAYKGYHQIQLAKSDEEKTAFHTGQRVYYYTKMPFGLKNDGATYERLVDKAFDSQIGQNIEVYIDDLVIKTQPQKMYVWAVEGMFLGYMITPEGVKPCPDKTEAVLQLPPPRTIKEVQSLNGKLASLNRSLSKSSEKSLPLFKTLKKCIKKSDFHWTPKAKQAFKQLKQHLSELPLLVAPKPRGADLRLQKWSVMLGEHNITYRPRTSVKGQVLADFLAEMPDESPPDASVAETQQDPWTLFTDGSSSSNNEAKFEALIAGLRIAAQMRVQNVHVSVDSKLVANQVLGAYVTKEENMIKYLEKVESLVSSFTNFSINQVPRSKNKKADALKYVIREIHEGSCSMHAGPRSVVAKAIRLGYYWPTMHRDARDMTRTCNDCQIHHPVTRSPQQPLTLIMAPWPFYKWGIDIAGPFPEGPGKVKFLIVAMDYFTKWIEAKVVATITGNQESRPAWVRETRIQLKNFPCRWAHRTMIKSSHGDTPFSLTYGRKVVIPTEIRMPIYRTAAVDVIHNDEELRLNLDLLEELCERAVIREAKTKSKMTKYYNARVCGVTFRPGDFVYRSNDASHAMDEGKLGPKWEGPYEVTKSLGYGAYKLRSTDGTVLPRTWNVANLKKCYL
uniref:Uncharacterized protein n=1 Tax=Tanacetum cinerariifolium TaxID=118510 RepID=A0A6L2NFE4_TANCI|nr:hypothetical protein [Tanacetum cinerariifolium]